MKKTRNIVMFLGIVLLFAVAGTLVIVGIANHEEPGLMGICWEDDGSVSYEVDGSDECPEMIWNHAPPFVVTAVTDNPHASDPRAATRGVVETINHRLGFELLQFDSGECGENVDICVTTGVAHEPGFMDTSGSAAHFAVDVDGELPVLHCEARTSNTGTRELLGLVLQHELLHCMGLAHDDFDSSIMRETQRSTPDREFPPRITDSDRDLLRSMYMQ